MTTLTVLRTRAEDLRWMAETGETAERAAARLGLTLKGLDRWGRRHDPELLARLHENGGPR